MITYLIEQGANVNAFNNEGETPLDAAIMFKPEMITYLIEQGADVNATHGDGETPLLQLAAQGNLAMLKHLVKHGAVFKDDQNNAALLLAAYTGDLPTVRYLIETHDADANDIPEFGSVLFAAVMSGSLDLVKYLVEEQGVKINADYSPPIVYVQAYVHKGQTEDVMRYLIDRGLNIKIDQENPYVYSDKTPLIHAAESNKIGLLKYLVEHGADVNIPDERGRTVLVYAKSLELIGYLVEHGANVNAKDEDGVTPLLYAAFNEDTARIKYLIAQGADVNAADKDGNTALSIAQENQDTQTVAYLKSQMNPKE